MINLVVFKIGGIINCIFENYFVLDVYGGEKKSFVGCFLMWFINFILYYYMLLLREFLIKLFIFFYIRYYRIM